MRSLSGFAVCFGSALGPSRPKAGEARGLGPSLLFVRSIAVKAILRARI